MKHQTSGIYFLKGSVIRGEGIGKTVGYPTANLDQRYFVRHPVPEGVYACVIKLKNQESRLHGIAIVGVPAQKDKRIKKVEVHILNFNKNMYGAYLEVEIVQRLRALKKFTGKQTLIKQIKKDISKAQKILCSPALPKKLEA